MKTSLRAIPKRGSLATVAALGATALLLTSCGAPPEAGGTSSEGASDYTGCIVSDSGGFDDQSFNQSSYEGLKKAETDLGIKVNQAESTADTDFGPNLRAMVTAGCDMTITVGFLLGDATEEQANANPDSHFAIVDFNYETPIANVKPIIYDTAQAAFMAGYLAAGTTKTGTVATFGGIKIPTVTIFMDGYADGVKYYNEQNNKQVKLLGWNKDAQDGSFTGDFEKQDVGKQLTQNFLDQGADIVMPVAGPVGKGAGAALQEAKDSGKDVKLIWVDSDGFLNAPEYADVMLSSVMKSMGETVEEVVKEDKDGNFSNTPYVGTLENNGVALAPFHNFDSEVSADMKSQLEQIKKDIISGTLVVSSEASPKS